MDVKIIAIAAVIIIVIIGIAAYFMTQQPQTTEETTPTTTTPKTTTTTTTQPTVTTTTTTTTTTSKQEYIEVQANTKVIQPTQDEQEQGILLKVKIDITIKNIGDKEVQLLTVYLDNLTLNSGNPLVEYAFYQYDDPEQQRLLPGETKQLTFNIVITQETSDQLQDWQEGTTHTIHVIYKVDGTSHHYKAEITL